MKYLCLIYDDEKKISALPKSEMDAFMGEYFAFTEGIRKSGHYVAGEAMQPVEAPPPSARETGRSRRPTDRLPRRRSNWAASI